jgi:hypothetical protein
LVIAFPPSASRTLMASKLVTGAARQHGQHQPKNHPHAGNCWTQVRPSSPPRPGSRAARARTAPPWRR